MPGAPAFSAFPLQPVALADAAHSRRGEASLVGLKDGSVLMAYGRFTGRNDPGYAALAQSRVERYTGSYFERDNDFGEIAAIILDPKGRASLRLAPEPPPANPPPKNPLPPACVVNPERILVPAPPDGLNAMNPALRRLPDGCLGLLYSHRISRHVASRRFLTSADEGATWSKPVVVFGEGYVSGAHDRFNVLASGRLLAPVHCTDDWASHYLHTRVARSDDAGRSWQVSDPIVVPKVFWPERPGMESGCVEPGVAERADGSLLMTLRTAMGTQFASESRDGGVTWSSPRSLEASSPSAPAHLSRLPGSDDLLLVWNPDYDARAPMNGHRHRLVAGLSRDGGRSFPTSLRRVLVDDPARNTDYPAVLHRNGETWIVVRQSDHAEVIQGRMSTCLMRVPWDWLRAPSS